MCPPQSTHSLSCWPVLQDENVRRKQAASGRKRGANVQSGGDGKRPRQAGQQWWAKNETAADGGTFEDDDDRQAYLEQVGTPMLHILSGGGGCFSGSTPTSVLQFGLHHISSPPFMLMGRRCEP